MTRRRVITLIIAFAVLAASVGALGWQWLSLGEAEAAAEMRIEAAESAKAEVADQVAEKVDAASASSFDYSLDRVREDAEIVENVARTISQWSGGEEYGDARGSLVSMGISEDSQLLTEFMPPLEVMGSNGETDIDMGGLYSEYRDIDISLAGRNGFVYSYLADVTCSSGNPNGATSDGSFLLWLSIDADGSVSDVGATALA